MGSFIIFVLGMVCGASVLMLIAVLENDRKNKR